MTCADCGKDISDRFHPRRGGQSAYLCLNCARARAINYRREHNRRIYRDPVLSARRKAYSAAWRRQKLAKRVLEVIKCEGCGDMFEMNRIGRRRLACVRCSAMYQGYTSVAKYMAAAKRRSIRERARRIARKVAA